jgi:hypothetical protein
MTMTMTVETPPPDRIRPAAVAGPLSGDLIALAGIYCADRAGHPPVAGGNDQQATGGAR